MASAKVSGVVDAKAFVASWRVSNMPNPPKDGLLPSLVGKKILYQMGWFLFVFSLFKPNRVDMGPTVTLDVEEAQLPAWPGDGFSLAVACVESGMCGGNGL